ncbi:hypothetical protein RGUI_2212 [Rhodovulum sp. P5]|nr:hypothetical protein RGUI_2212 [Rhodovulum sp. P5]
MGPAHDPCVLHLVLPERSYPDPLSVCRAFQRRSVREIGSGNKNAVERVCKPAEPSLT